MKFLCSNCKAKYQIADEKVAGRTLRMTCRRCKQEIVIHGEPDGVAHASYPSPTSPGARVAPPPPPPPVSALGADFQLQVAGHAQARMPIAAPMDQWHVGINDVPVGPMRREEIAHKLAAGAISPESLAWREGLDDWLPIRQIAELAVLFAPPAVGPPPPAPVHLPPPRVLAQPAQRTDLAPIGGRAGAAPGYALQDWAPVSEPQMSHSQVAMNPLLEASAERRNPVLPSWPVMFALAGGFAFLMSALAITGARWLVSSQRPAAPAASAASGTETARPAHQERAGAEQTGQSSELVIGDLEAQNQARAAARGRPGDPNRAPAGKQPPKKELSAEQKAMLARMGGGDGTAVADLRPQSGTTTGSSKQNAGSLTADQLSKVVLRGREQLQRCYETALRGSGSSETVRMDVEITVSAAGNVTNAKMGGQGLPGMSQCIERTVRMWRFPNAGDASTFKFPVVFQPGA